jgi:hypothetical protein
MSRHLTSTRAALAALVLCALAIIVAYAFPLSILRGESSFLGGEIIINELDSDTPSTDVAEFVELFDGGSGNTPLDGYVVVFFNGGAANDASYAAFDLDGFATNADGYFTLGNSAVPGVDLIFPNSSLQNGPDAVAIFAANGSDFPNGTPITATNIRDAIVYANSTTIDAGLLVLLNAGQAQVNENALASGQTVSMQRVPNGLGGARNTNTYQVLPPTPDGPALSPTAASLVLSGRVTNASGQGIRGALITVEGGGLESPRVALSSSFGYFGVEGLAIGTYLITIHSKGHIFADPSRSVMLADNLSGFDFVAEP